MRVNQYIVRYKTFENSIQFPTKVNSFIIAHFASAIQEWAKRKQYRPLTIDFAGVQKPYSNGIRNGNMEPLIQQLLDKAISQRLSQ